MRKGIYCNAIFGTLKQSVDFLFSFH